MNENVKYNIIKKLVESNGNNQRAAIQIIVLLDTLTE